MKILLATSSYAPVLGGVQTVVENLAIGLQARGHEVMVLANRVPLRLARKEQLHGVKVRRIWFPSFERPDVITLKSMSIFILGFLVAPISIIRLLFLLKRYQPGVINVHHPQTMIPFFRIIRSMEEANVITSLHGYDLERFVPEAKRNPQEIELQKSGKALLRMREWLYLSDLHIANSVYTASIAKKIAPQLTKGSLKVLYNAINPKRFQEPISLQLPFNQSFIFAFGRFDRQKGFDLLLSAFAKIKDQIPHHLVIAGSGPEVAAYQAMIRENQLGSRVYLPGRVQPQEVVAYLQAAAFVVVPSRWEAFGITVLEALAAGKAVVTTQVGGIPEFASYQYCHICTLEVDALAKGIKQYARTHFSNKTLEQQQMDIWQRFNWDKYIDQYEKALFNL